MMSDRTFAALGLTALVAAGLAATPAISAMSHVSGDRASALSALFGRFTPATGDPRLLQRYARLSAETRNQFRFTPAMPRSENRAVTLVVRANSSAVDAAIAAVRPEQAVTVAPVSYRLGSALGYTAFATPAARPSVDLAALPAARRQADPVDARPSRFGANMRLATPNAPVSGDRAIDADRAYAVDVTGSYRLSHNLDVTAGIRYRREDDRVVPLTDGRQDSQAVYVGTRFRF